MIIAGALTLAGIGIIVLAYAVLMTAGERPLPFRYEDITPGGTYPRDLCPNEPLQFDLRVAVSSAPSVVQVVENWQGRNSRTIPDLSPTYHIHESSKVAQGTQSIPIPNLSPGGWVYERAATVNTVATPTLLLIPFTVRADCLGS